MSFVNICEKIDHVIIALHCIFCKLPRADRSIYSSKFYFLMNIYIYIWSECRHHCAHRYLSTELCLQTRGNEFIQCWIDFCHVLKCYCSFKIPAIPFIWPKSLYKRSIALVTSQKQEMWTVVVIIIVISLMTFLSIYISSWWCQMWDTCICFMVVSQSEVRVSTEHGINIYIFTMCTIDRMCAPMEPLRGHISLKCVLSKH